MGFGDLPMRQTLGMAIAVALVAAACGSPATTPPPATPAPTPDPRHSEIDRAQATWDAKGPRTVAYTTTETVGGAGTTVHVTEMDGRVEALVLEAGRVAPSDGGRQLSIDGLFDTAREALDAAGSAQFDVDQFYGYLPRLGYETDVADGSFTIEVRDLVTPTDRTAAGAARDALNTILQRWDQLSSPAWEYTWTRFGAADTESTQTSYRIRHGGGQTTLATADGDAAETPPSEATIQGTIEAAVAVMASGGWVDVALDPVGLDALIAIDPSPSAAGDATWIRIDYTDRFSERARDDLQAARSRWARADLKRYGYRWTWNGSDGAWSWGVTMRGDGIRLKPGPGAPRVEDAFVSPRVAELFALIDQVLTGGGTVDVAYDDRLGYPARVEFTSTSEWAPKGTITITKLRER